MTKSAVLVLFSAGAVVAADAPATFERYCFQCHGEAIATAGVNLQQLVAGSSLADDFKQWKKVATALEEGVMPPAGLPAPSDGERSSAAEWIRASLRDYAGKHDGDPGRVTVRRLTSAEYAYTIRDLTGVDLDLARHFAGDAVGGEGFASFGDVQFMADSNLESYLEVAKLVADHAVIGAGPLQFGADPGMSGFELSAIYRIRDLYRRHGFRAVSAEGGRPFGMDLYGKAFYSAWRYKNREALGQADATLHQIARREGVSRRFIDHIWSAVNSTEAAFPVSEVVSLWRGLPGPQTSEDDVRARCAEIQEFVVGWPRWLFGAGRVAAGGAGDERALVINDASVSATKSHEFSYTRRAPRPDAGELDEDPGSVFFSVESANQDSSDEPVLIWRNPTVVVRGRDRGTRRSRPLRKLLSRSEAEQFRFGVHPDGKTRIGKGDFVTVGETERLFHIPLDDEARGFGVRARVEAQVDGSDAVMRVIFLDNEQGALGRPESALLADPESEGFQAWKAQVLEYAAFFPQASHGEPTPADRDPIPPPFNNTYNQPERDRFHFRVKYYRNDGFLYEKILDDDARTRLDEAWHDLKASFEFHDAIFRFTDDKFGLGFGDKTVADLTPAEIEVMPEEPRQYVEALHQGYHEVQSAQLAARPGHIDDVLDFAERAWRRPLKPEEKDGLRRLYNVAREERSLDHRAAIRAMLTQALVAPEFLYRLERPDRLSGPSKLSSWELASRLSYFLWSSAPDAELRRAAASGGLDSVDEIARQVRRMLADPKARRLATEFFGQWLGFYRFDQHAGVDAKRFPEFTDPVKSAMYDEAVSFFEHIIREKRPLREIFSADYTFLNEALAGHYRAEVEADREIRLVEGADAFERGGLMRLGAVLTATSAPLRTSPVKRGDWILRRVLGTPTPPPPPDAGSLPGDEKSFGERTVREQLEAHRANPTCAACHSRIDPLGFSLENYDAVGRWRESYDNGKPVDASSVLAGGTPITGVESMLAYIESRERQVALNLSEKLLGFALGRTVIASDQPLLDRMAADGFGATFDQLAVEVATSRQFRYRRGLDDQSPVELADGE